MDGLRFNTRAIPLLCFKRKVKLILLTHSSRAVKTKQVSKQPNIANWIHMQRMARRPGQDQKQSNRVIVYTHLFENVHVCNFPHHSDTIQRLGDIIFQGPKSNCFRGELVLRVTWPLIGYCFPVTYQYKLHCVNRRISYCVCCSQTTWQQPL